MDHWYPKDPKKRAKVDIYLDWHQTFVRQGIAAYIFKKEFNKALKGKEASPEELKFLHSYVVRTLTLIERMLSSDKFLCGPQVSIADLNAVCEIAQFEFTDFDLSKWPKVIEWKERLF
mmetsp:Transcript_44912/g.32860  ORF Transcript_44912/g.32860 Transcript_44912/m.32860 type:complete len:118 (-) Transcript_44912:117-470(-)